MSVVIENNIGINKKDISVACKITEVTISKCFKRFNNYKTFLLS